MYNVIRKQLDTEIQLRKVKYNYMWHIKNRKHRNRYGIDNVIKSFSVRDKNAALESHFGTWLCVLCTTTTFNRTIAR